MTTCFFISKSSGARILLFACSYNAKLPRFNSRFLQPGAEAVNAFSQDWSSDNTWLVPPTTLTGRVLCHMRDCKAVGTLIVPMWKSAQFWSLLCSDGVHLNSFVKDCLFLPNRPDLFVKGRAKNTLFGTKALKSRCLAIRIDFADDSCLSNVVFFVPLPKGGVLYVDLRRFAQVCLTRFSIDLLHYCTVKYHEQENHFIEVLPSSWWSAGDWIALNLVSCYMTVPRWRIKNSLCATLALSQVFM